MERVWPVACLGWGRAWAGGPYASQGPLGGSRIRRYFEAESQLIHHLIEQLPGLRLLAMSEPSQERERRCVDAGQECVEGRLDEAVGAGGPTEHAPERKHSELPERLVLCHACRTPSPR